MTGDRYIRWLRESTFVPINTTDSENRLTNHYKVRTMLRTFQTETRGIFKNSQLQIKFTGSYKKKECTAVLAGLYYCTCMVRIMS